MKDRKPSSAKTTKERIERDKRQYDRLVGKVNKLLYHESPGFFGWIEDSVKKVGDKLKDAGKWVADTLGAGNKEAWSDADKALKHLSDFETDVSNEAIAKTRDIYDSWRASYGEKEDEARGSVYQGSRDRDIGIKDVAGDAWSTIEGLGGKVGVNLKGVIDAIWALILKIKEALGDAFVCAMEALAAIPDLFTEFIVKLDSLFSIDEATFVEQNLKFVTLQKELAERMRGVEV